LGEVVLRLLRIGDLQPPPNRNGPYWRLTRGFRRRSWRSAGTAPVRCVRCSLGADPGRWAPALPRELSLTLNRGSAVV
jgi:hypothetical protein